MEWKELLRSWSGQEVVVRYDREADAWMFIALHSTTGKRSVGGVRMKVYPAPEDGLLDAIRLAEGMTHKWAAIEVGYGGGKGVIALTKPVTGDDRTALLLRFGRMIDSLNGRYGSGPDIGTTPADMALLATVTRYVHCYDWNKKEPYDPGIYTALGVFIGMKAGLRYATGSDSLAGKRVLIQGVGDTGEPLARSVAAEGGTVLLNDLNPTRAEALAKELGGEVVGADRLFDVPCDVYAPCAIGATLNARTIPKLTCKVIAGSANNQLETAADAERLLERGILYAPDYVVNGAGAVSLAMVDEGASFEAIRTEIAKMDRRLTEIFTDAAARKESPLHAADRRVAARLAGAA
ncbi:MAG: Glu/Leu/Phe/Val dehydrogenase dimerization domain-containing protein [Gemmatimonadales bacterium]